MNWDRLLTVTRTDLRMLRQSPDFWIPMVLLASIFFVVAPLVLLSAVTVAESSPTIQSIGSALEVLPESAQAGIKGSAPVDRMSYALAVYLFAPLAVVVPMTISTAIGANTIVGEREKGTGEFLAHSPASEKEIYLGKLLASFLPGYATTLVGFSVYSVLVNVLVGPKVGGWFFPTREWWWLMLWVVPPFLALTLSVVLRLSARVKSAAAAQQASGLVTLPLIMISYAQSSGALYGARQSAFWVGLIAWFVAINGLIVGTRAVTRSRLLGVDAA